MSVTVYHNGTPLTFPNIDDPKEAYRILESNNQSAPPSVSFDAANVPQGIDPEHLNKNKDWLAASKTLYEATQGKRWDGPDKDLANWGLWQMAYFNYNLVNASVDAVSLKYASPEQQKAFLFMLDAFDKVDYSVSGFGRALASMGMDPTTYVGLGTFGIGTAASKAAGFATKEAVKAAIRTGVWGALEGAAYGAAQSGIEQSARINAHGQEDVDWAKVGLGATIGGAVGGVAAPLIAAGVNRFGRKAITTESERGTTNLAEETATPPIRPTNEGEQLSLNLSDRPYTEQPNLPMDLSVEWRLDALPESFQPKPQESISEMSDRLREKWGVQDQQSLDLVQPKEGIYAYAGQGELFPGLAPQTKATPSIEPTDATLRSFNDALDKTSPFDREVRRSIAPTPDERIGQGNGLTFEEFGRLLKRAGQELGDTADRGIGMMFDLTKPLGRALAHMSPAEAKLLAKELIQLATTNREFEGLSAAAIQAENKVASVLKYHLSSMERGANPQLAAERVLEAERILTPLKALTDELSSTSGRSLNISNYRSLSGKQKQTVDSILREAGIDPSKATPQQRVDAVSKLLKDVEDETLRVLENPRLTEIRAQLNDLHPEDDLYKFMDLKREEGEIRAQLEAERKASLGVLGKTGESINRVIGDVANYAAATVLSPASLTVNTISNAFRVFSRPLLNYVAKGPTDAAAAREMLHVYGVMVSTWRRSLDAAKLSFDLGQSLLNGEQNKWLEHHFSELKISEKSSMRLAAEHHVVNFFLRGMTATDEFFRQMSYHGLLEGEAVYKVLQRAQTEGLSKAETDAAIKSAIENVTNTALSKAPDATTVSQVRMAGLQRGLKGDNLTEWVKNTIQNNKDLLRRAESEHGISLTNDLLFSSDFSGTNAGSALAKKYEQLVQSFPLLKIMGQLFFRTPVRVFEAGIRMTPGLNLATFAVDGGKFFKDLSGSNGPARQLIARGEMFMSYAFAVGTMTAYATGNITGDGGSLDYREQRKLIDAGWRPYSIKVGDTYYSYRNLDPFATPLKIITNTLDRFQMLDYRKAQGEFDAKSESKEMFARAGLIFGATIGAIKDASLTSGIGDTIDLVTAIGDPERNETKIEKFLGSKMQLAVPNAIRRAERYLVPGMGVANDPTTMEQFMTATINPASPTVTKQFDALGNQRSPITPGLLGYFGLDFADAKTRTRDLPKAQIETLKEIADLSAATGKRFIPSYKSEKLYPGKDLREEMSYDGRNTVYNKAMEQFNKEMPYYAEEFFSSWKGAPAGRRGEPGPKAVAFEKLQNRVWENSLRSVLQYDQKAFDARNKALQGKYDVRSGVFEQRPRTDF